MLCIGLEGANIMRKRVRVIKDTYEHSIDYPYAVYFNEIDEGYEYIVNTYFYEKDKIPYQSSISIDAGGTIYFAKEDHAIEFANIFYEYYYQKPVIVYEYPKPKESLFSRIFNKLKKEK